MRKINILFGCFLVFAASNLLADGFDHSKFDGILQTYVKDGLVDYKGLKANKIEFENYLSQLEQVNPDDFASWSREAKMAFWINAYNAITIEGILRNYPIQWGGFFARRRFPKSSIRQIGKFWDTVFVRPLGRERTLNQIEHEILRKQFADPRIHFVIVCASIGCPVLESHAFFAEDLEQRLERAARNFILNPEKVRLDRKANRLYLSSIFDWYKDDFRASRESEQLLRQYGKKERGIVEFVLKYIGETEKNYILQNQPKIKYLKYDWSLNEQK